ncbi:hypothetical protein ZWY2020_015770 [Hordeum vulgare]|nr:hypothetical protein ZWY2020_015770 [Hordeum vulgare]
MRLFSSPQLQQVILDDNAFNGTLDLGRSISSELSMVSFKGNDFSSVTMTSSYNGTLALAGNPVCDHLPNTAYCNLTQHAPSPAYTTSLVKCFSGVCLPEQSMSPRGDVLLLPALPVPIPSFGPRHLQKQHGRTAATPAPSSHARPRQQKQKRTTDASGRHPALQPLRHCRHVQPVRARLPPPLPRLRPRILPPLHGQHDRGTQVPRLPRPQVQPPLDPPRRPGRHRRRGAPLPLLLRAPRMGLFFLHQVTRAALGREEPRTTLNPSSSSSTTSISASYNTVAGEGYSASMSMRLVPFLCSSSSSCSRLDRAAIGGVMRRSRRGVAAWAPPLTAGGDGKKNTTMVGIEPPHRPQPLKPR